MRNEPVGRWIRKQSGGRTRLVHIGRPWAKPDQFDLVITTPQYRLPERDNVLHNAMTLHRASADRLEAEAGNWKSRFMHLPKPYTGVIVGGNSGPYTLGPKAVESIVRQASRMAGQSNGSLHGFESKPLMPATCAQRRRIPDDLICAAQWMHS